MKLLKVLSLGIVLLFNCFISWSQSGDNVVPSTGEVKGSDTIVNVPISIIKEANIKLLERKYYIAISEQQDSIINLKTSYIIEQNKVIDDLQNRILKINKMNSELEEQYKKQQKRTTIAGGFAGGFAVCTVVAVLIASLK